MSTKGYIAFFAVILVIAGLIFYLNRTSGGSSEASGPTGPPPPEPKLNTASVQTAWPSLLKLTVAPALGNPHAPWTVIEVGDFQCPNCGDAEPLVMDAIRGSGGKAKLYFINFPLPTLHPHAMVAAEAGEAAAAQGKFWPMYHLMYTHQDELIDSEIQYNARTIPGLDTKKLAADMASHKYIPVIASQTRAMNELGIESVPTLLVRSPTGKIAWFCGTRGTKHVLGIGTFAATAPWGGGMGVATVQHMLEADQQARENAPTS